jgi:curved DNA-binding protein CbpA
VVSCFSILGVTPHCTDDDIKKYYKRQAVLVHPDKNNQPGAEEAFKILVHAFELIGEPVSIMLLILIANSGISFIQGYETCLSSGTTQRKLGHPIFSDTVVGIVLPRWMEC